MFAGEKKLPKEVIPRESCDPADSEIHVVLSDVAGRGALA